MSRNGLLAVSFFALSYFTSNRNKKSITIIFITFLLGFFSIKVRDLLNYPIISYGIITKAKDNYFLFWTQGNLYYVSNYKHTYHVGDIIYIQGTCQPLSFHSIESHFDFKQYLIDLGVKGSYLSNDIQLIKSNPISYSNWLNAFINDYPEDVKKLWSIFLLNDGDFEISKWNGVSHLGYLFAPTGMYLTLLIECFDKIKNKWIKFVYAIAVFPIFLLVLTRFSFFRAMSFFILKKLSKRFKIGFLELLSLWGIFCLIISPYYLFQIGFYIPIFIAFFTRWIMPLMKKKYRKFVMPILIEEISLFQNHYLSITRSIFHLLLFPFFFFGIITSIIALYIPTLFYIPNYLSLLEKVSYLSAKMDWSMYVSSPYFLIVIFIGIILYIFFLYLHLDSLKKKAFFAVMILSFSSCFRIFKPLQVVYFIDVGQGNSTLVIDRNTAILIDVGGSKKEDLAWTTLIPFLKKNDVRKLSALMISHNDYDHSGAMDSLKKDFPIESIFYSQQNFPYKVNDLTIENLNSQIYSNENDNSLVLYFALNRKRFLIMSDVSKKVEIDIIKNYPNLKTDYILLGHHGSETSSGKAFLKSVNPKLAIISVGYQNSYGHPSKETLKTLNELNIPYKRTDEDGTIRIIC